VKQIIKVEDFRKGGKKLMALFEEATGGEILLRQNDLKMDLMSHQVYGLIDMYCYTEDGDEAPASTEKKSLGKTIADKIRAILKAISDIIEIFKANFSKNKLTVEEYLSSETGQMEIQLNIEAIHKEIDEEYLAARKIVSKISNVTNFPAEDVAAFCDKWEARIHNNRDKIIPAGKAVASTAAISAVRKQVYKNIDSSKGFVAQTNKILDEIEDEERKALKKPSIAQEKAIKAAKMQQKGLAGTKYRLTARLSSTLEKMVKGWSYIGDTLDSEVKREMKKSKKK
jgi:CHASE3 domain sensor protein